MSVRVTIDGFVDVIPDPPEGGSGITQEFYYSDLNGEYVWAPGDYEQLAWSGHKICSIQSNGGMFSVFAEGIITVPMRAEWVEWIDGVEVLRWPIGNGAGFDLTFEIKRVCIDESGSQNPPDNKTITVMAQAGLTVVPYAMFRATWTGEGGPFECSAISEELEIQEGPETLIPEDAGDPTITFATEGEEE